MTPLPLLTLFAVGALGSPTVGHNMKINQHWSQNSTIGMPVNTTSGRIIGQPNDMYPYVSEYLGIPYAEPPTGNLRFAPPECYNGTSDITANTQPSSCLQEQSPPNSSWPTTFRKLTEASSNSVGNGSEDCLYLNLWSKFPSPGSPLKPVLIWIYGGGFRNGGISDKTMQGAIIAEEQDVVLVSINYRGGIFGFSGAPNLRQNVALLDQRMAIEWVRDNAAGFGGDPDRITIWGQSAGAASIDLYNHIWLDDPIIAGSIMESGSALSFGNRVPSTTAKGWFTVAETVGCGNSTRDVDAVLSCLRSKDAVDVLKASYSADKTVGASLPELEGEYASIMGIFGPTIDNITVFQNYSQRGVLGRFIKRPILTGSNDDEGCWFAEVGKLPASQHYQNDVTTEIFTCPIYYNALYHTEAGLPTWKYRYFGAYPNLYLNDCPGRNWHAQELNVIFNSSWYSGEAPTPLESSMGWYFRNMWTTFAHDPTNGLTDRGGWPVLGAGEGNVNVIGLNQTLHTVQNASVWDLPCLTALVSGAPNF